jgi:hypothetical protein
LRADSLLLVLDLRIEQIQQGHLLAQHASVRLWQLEPPQMPHAPHAKEVAALGKFEAMLAVQQGV